MTMNIEQFLKAAKRYSAKANIPLSQAQEDMAGFFGFKNLHAARKSLGPKPSITPANYENLIGLDRLSGDDLIRFHSKPLIYVIYGPIGTGKTTLAWEYIERSRKDFNYVGAPSKMGAIFDSKLYPHWSGLDGLVIDEPLHYDRASFAQAIKKLERDCFELDKILVILLQSKDDLQNWGVVLESKPAYCKCQKDKTYYNNFEFTWGDSIGLTI